MDSRAEQKKLEYCQILMNKVNTPGQFPDYVRCRLTRLTPDGEAEGVLEVSPSVLNVWGTVHGGALSTLADTVAGTGVAAATGRGCVTVNYSMNYLHPATGGVITCTAHPAKLGNHICVMRTTLKNKKGDAVATGEFTFYVTTRLDKGVL